jgi:lysophospholipase L1-like esterase
MEILPVNRSVLRTALAAAVMAALLIPCRLTAQEPVSKPETMAPAPAQAAPAAASLTQAQKPITHDEQLKNDWPWLGKFKEADLALGAPAAGENRVVFMGDSITQGWHLDVSFPGKPYVNRGISGQTSPQMVLRFRQDVIDLMPKVVVILAGTNDIAENTGPITLEESEGNLMTMAELATANHIRVVLCSVLPAFDFSWSPGKTPALKIDALNAWIKAYAAEKGYVYVDYHTAMKDERDGLPKKLSDDGVHPNAIGYAIMAPLAEAGIEKALER